MAYVVGKDGRGDLEARYLGGARSCGAVDYAVQDLRRHLSYYEPDSGKR